MKKSGLCLFSYLRYVCSTLIIVAVFLTVLICVCADTGLVLTTTPETIYESSLDGAVISLKLMEDQFTSDVSVNSFELINAPPGLSIASVKVADKEHVDIVMAYNQIDFDADFTEVAVKIRRESLMTSPVDLISEPMTVRAVLEKEAVLNASIIPSKTAPLSLDGMTVDLTLSNYNFKNPFDIKDYILNNAPEGTSIDYIEFINYRHVIVRLKYSGTQIDKDISNFSISAYVNTGIEDYILTSNALNVSVDAEAPVQSLVYNNLNKSYPIDIDIMGFNGKDGLLYLMIDFKTTRSITFSQTPRFNFYIEIYNGAGTLIGTAGSYAAPLSAIGPRSYGVARAKNVPAQITAPLDASIKINVIVKNVVFFQ